MATKRLCDQDSYLKEFTAKLLRQGCDEDGTFYAVLDETAFYPTGGGQPCDTGFLDGVRVTHVEKDGDEIRHYLAQKLDESRSAIHAKIDWERRFDHMQQHAGQHILSAMFDDRLGMRTIAFHMGTDRCTIDLDTVELSEELAEEAETMANSIVLQNLLIQAKFVDHEDLLRYHLRKAPSVTENIRLVIIEGIDYNPCGGTHPVRTGEVGPIKIVGWEAHRSHIRVSFNCGWRSLSLFKDEHRELGQMALFYNIRPEMVLSRTRKLEGQLKTWENECKSLRNRLIDFEVSQLGSLLNEESKNPVVAKRFEERPVKEIRELAGRLTKAYTRCTALFITSSGENVQIVCAQGSDARGDMKRTLSEVLPLIHGKGGGDASLAQGVGKLDIPPEKLFERLKSAVSHSTA